MFTWVALIFVAGGIDRVTVLFDLSYTSQIWFYRVAIWIIPVVVGFIAYRVCIELQHGEEVERTREGRGAPRKGDVGDHRGRLMLTVLQQKLAEAHGLAIAAAAVTRTVEARIEDADLRRELRSMRDDAEETRQRCLRVERAAAGGASRRAARARDLERTRRPPISSGRGSRPVRTRSARGASSTMGEAGEVAAWTAVAALAMRGDDGDVAELAAWALPVQKRHLETALDAIAPLSTTFDPVGPRWG